MQEPTNNDLSLRYKTHACAPRTKKITLHAGSTMHKQGGFNLVECLIALSCLLILINYMQSAHAKINHDIHQAEQKLNQYWAFNDLSQRLYLYKHAMIEMLRSQHDDNKKLTLDQSMECSSQCAVFAALRQESNQWQAKIKTLPSLLKYDTSWTIALSQLEPGGDENLAAYSVSNLQLELIFTDAQSAAQMHFAQVF